MTRKTGRIGYLRSSTSLFGWMLARAISQGTLVVVLARSLGADSYGQFVAIMAIASFLAPFVGFGLAQVLLRNGAKDPSHILDYLYDAVRWWWVTVGPAIVVAILLALALLPPPLPLAAMAFAIAMEVAASSLTELRARHRQAEHRIGLFGVINAGLPFVRLVGITLLVLMHKPSVESALWIHGTCSLLYMLFLVLPTGIRARDGHPSETMTPAVGLPFGIAAFAMRVQGEFNKPLLAHVGFDLAGFYSAAQRANDLAAMPLVALQEALWPRLYSYDNPSKQMQAAGLLLLCLSALCGLIIWLCAPLLPALLGSSFNQAVGVMRGLALLPLVQSFRALLNFHAIHHRRMRWIACAYVVGAVSSVCLLAVLVPDYGLKGAIIATYFSELAMISVLIISTRSWLTPKQNEDTSSVAT